MPRRFALALLPILAHPSRAEIIDRVAVSLDRDVIALSEVLAEIRIHAFLDRAKPVFDPAAKRKAAGRLVERLLIRREMEFSRYPMPAAAEAQPLLDRVRAQFNGQAAFEKALREAGIGEAELSRSLLWRVAVLRFVELRFRTGIRIPAEDLETAYRKRVEQWRQQGVNPIPSFEQSRDAIETALSEERANQALDLWLGQERTKIDVEYHEEAFR